MTRGLKRGQTYVDLQICVEQNLEVVIRGTRISDHKARLEILGAQCHGVSQGELVGPFGIADHGV